MKINYNEQDKSIEINDEIKTQYWFTNAMALLNIINSIIFPVFVLEKKEFLWFGFIWIIIGFASLVGLIYQIMKKSPAEKLKLTEINSLTEKQFIGRKTLALKLKNGKFRDLITMKNEKDINETRELFRSLGIKFT